MQVTYLRPFMHTRASRGIVKNFNPAPNSEGIEPPNSYKAMETMWKRDEVIATAFDTTVDMVTRNGWDFVKKDAEDSNSYDSERKKAMGIISRTFISPKIKMVTIPSWQV